MVGASSELMQLQQLSIETEALNDRTKRYYSRSFPKICAKCNVIYKNLEEFRDRTRVPLRRAGVHEICTVFDGCTVKETQICQCGAAITICSNGDRRDFSFAGRKRRQLFDCLCAKLVKSGKKSEATIRKELRNIVKSLDCLFTMRHE